jgi:hypothetical protein
VAIDGRHKRLAAGVDDELAGTDLAVLTSERDALLLGLLEQKAAIAAEKRSLLEVEVAPTDSGMFEK